MILVLELFQFYKFLEKKILKFALCWVKLLLQVTACSHCVRPRDRQGAVWGLYLELS